MVILVFLNVKDYLVYKFQRVVDEKFKMIVICLMTTTVD
jgi:hypothetical protein